jgi:hypothetical protein
MAPLAVTMLLGRESRAQSSDPGASFLLVPFDPRSVAMGGAGVADPLGTTALFVNPAAFARLTGRVVGVDYAVDQQSSRLAASFTAASRVLGAFGASVYYDNLGTQELTDDNGVVTGNLAVADYAYAASYAVGFTSRFTAGVTAKLVQYRFDCTGACSPLARSHPSTGAIDAGAQYDLGAAKRLHVGAVVRNVGLRLQFKDRAQADPLPTQVAVGLGWDAPNVERYLPETSLRLAADATRGLGVPLGETIHLGAEGTYRKTVSVRVGYAYYTRATGYAGLAAGFGVSSTRLTLDVGRQLTTNALFADKPPTYVGLRYSF